MITYFHLIFHVLFIFFKGLVSFEIMSLKLIFFWPPYEATISAEGWGEGGTKEWPLRCLNLNLVRENLFILRSKGASFLDCSISTSSCHQEHIETRGLLIETYIFFFKSGFKKKMPEPQDIDHALQTSLPFQGFWPKNMI